MSPSVKGMLIGLLVGFVAWCVREMVVEYRFQRKEEANHIMVMRGMNWKWHRGVRPLFHEQRRKDEVFGEDV